MSVGSQKLRWAASRRHYVFLLAAAAALATFAANTVLSEVRPGNVWSLVYGSIAAALLVIAAALGLRRRAMRTSSKMGVGATQAWLTVHVYGSLLFLVLMLMHTGFRVPSGRLTWWLWVLSLWTVFTGVVGRVFQKWIPRLLGSGLATEVLYERIPELVDELSKRAREVAESADDAVRALYDRVLAPALSRPRPRMIYFVEITGGLQARLKEFSYLSALLPAEEREKLDELERLYRAKLEIDAHLTLQRPLRWWLFAHLPPSIVLMALLLLHLYTVLFY